MPAPLDVDREQYRPLVMELGYAETSRRTGIKEGTLRQWGNRFGWLDYLKAKPQVPSSIAKVPVTGVTKAPDAYAELLAADERETRLSLSRAARSLASKAETADLDQAADALKTGKLAALVHRWADGSEGVSVVVNMALMGVRLDGPAPTVIDLP